MNPDKPSREQIEARLTALLLGELPAEEAELLRWTIAQDAELQKLHDRLKLAIGLVRETIAHPAESSAEKTVPRKLSDERRQKLLAHFKTPRPKPSFLLKRFEVHPLVAALAVVAIIAVLAAMLLPSLAAAKRKSQQVLGLSSLSRGEGSRSDERYSLLNSKRSVRAATTQPPPAPSSVEAPPVAEAPAGGIVLPETEPPSTASGAYGLTPVQNNSSAPLTSPTGSLPAGNAEVFNSLTLGGGSGGGGAGGTTTPNSTTFAWNDSGADRLDGKAPVIDPRTGLPARDFPNGTTPGVAGENSVNVKLSPETFDHGVITGGLASPSEPTKGIGENGAANVPILENMPLSGRLTTGTPFQQRLAKVENRGSSSAGTLMPAPAARIPSAPAGGARKELSLSDYDASGLNGNNSFAGGISDAIEAKPKVAKDGSRNANSVDLFFQTNTVLLADSSQQKSVGVPATPRAKISPPALTLTQNELQKSGDEDRALPQTKLPAPVPQPEILTRDNAFSTFSLNVSDVSFKLAAASLQKGQMPDAASIRSEEFINAFDYRDPEAAAGQPLAFTAERARYPFAHNRELLRFSIKTAAAGRQAGRPLNLVLLLDTSGSMERADRVAIIREALRVLAKQLQPQDTVSVVTFARTARLWADGVPGDKAGETLEKVSGITPEGGTNLEEAMRLAYETARRHYVANGLNRVVMLTDGAANLGNVDSNALRQKVEANRKQGIALDCFGIGWEGYNDDLLEQLSSNGDGRYAFMNSPDEAAGEFAAKLAGALQVAAQDVKVQVEFNPQRVVSYRQIGYAKHQLTQEQFRDNSVAAGEIAAQEAGNALYTIETKPDGVGPIATVRVRYKVPGTTDYRERSWGVDYRGNAPALEQSSAAMRLAATASAFSEWLASSPFAEEVTPDQLLNYLSGVPAVYGADPRPKQLEWMIRQANSVSGK